jgi:hypothetical protein
MSERMTFAQCERKAKDIGYDSATFDICAPNGKRIGAKWLDAYFGLFMVDGSNGFCRAEQFEDMGCWCENIKSGEQAPA